MNRVVLARRERRIDSDLHFVSGAVQHRSLLSKLGVSKLGSERSLQGHHISVRLAESTGGLLHKGACCPFRLSVVEGSPTKRAPRKDREQPIWLPPMVVCPLSAGIRFRPCRGSG